MIITSDLILLKIFNYLISYDNRFTLYKDILNIKYLFPKNSRNQTIINRLETKIIGINNRKSLYGAVELIKIGYQFKEVDFRLELTYDVTDKDKEILFQHQIHKKIVSLHGYKSNLILSGYIRPSQSHPYTFKTIDIPLMIPNQVTSLAINYRVLDGLLKQYTKTVVLKKLKVLVDSKFKDSYFGFYHSWSQLERLSIHSTSIDNMNNINVTMFVRDCVKLKSLKLKGLSLNTKSFFKLSSKENLPILIDPFFEFSTITRLHLIDFFFNQANDYRLPFEGSNMNNLFCKFLHFSSLEDLILRSPKSNNYLNYHVLLQYLKHQKSLKSLELTDFKLLSLDDNEESIYSDFNNYAIQVNCFETIFEDIKLEKFSLLNCSYDENLLNILEEIGRFPRLKFINFTTKDNTIDEYGNLRDIDYDPSIDEYNLDEHYNYHDEEDYNALPTEDKQSMNTSGLIYSLLSKNTNHIGLEVYNLNTELNSNDFQYHDLDYIRYQRNIVDVINIIISWALKKNLKKF